MRPRPATPTGRGPAVRPVPGRPASPACAPARARPVRRDASAT
jgi:hypothetical protein